VPQGQVVLVDTNIIIEAFRTRCWKALTTYYRVETVEKCYEEALTGDRLRPGYVEVESKVLKEKLTIHRVETVEQAALTLTCPDVDALDAGERCLFAHAHGRSDAWIATCADRAAVRIALTLGWKERIYSLEVLCKPTGAKPGLKRHFTEDWLSEVRTDFVMGNLG
jgi:predicted nucleic acid-binding protein